MKVVANGIVISPANYDIKDRQPSITDHWVVFTSSINPYYTDLLTNIDSDSGMHLDVFFWSRHPRAEFRRGGTSRRLEEREGESRGLPRPQKHGKMSLSARWSHFPLTEDYLENNMAGMHRFNSSHCTSFSHTGLRCLQCFQSIRHVGLAPGILLWAGFKMFLHLNTWSNVFLI